jgi:hypothetical protein
MRGAGHVARMEEIRNAYEIWLQNLKRKDHSEDTCVDRKIILEWMLGKQGEKMWIGFI